MLDHELPAARRTPSAPTRGRIPGSSFFADTAPARQLQRDNVDTPGVGIRLPPDAAGPSRATSCLHVNLMDATAQLQQSKPLGLWA